MTLTPEVREYFAELARRKWRAVLERDGEEKAREKMREMQVLRWKKHREKQQHTA